MHPSSRSRPLRWIALAAAAALLVVVFLQVRDAAGRTSASPLTDRLDHELAALVPAEGAGCAAAVYQDDGLAWTGTRGWAVTQGRHPITDDTVFGLGVTTQQFTGAAVLLLAHQGRLDLDAPLSRYLPGLPAWSHAVTIWNLLLGTSGIPNAHDLLVTRQTPPVTTTTVLRAISRVPALDFRPGTGGDDTDGDYALLGLVVHAVSHRSLADFLRSDVFPAAGMRSAVLDRDPRGSDVALSYQLPTDDEPYRDQVWRTVGDIGLHATAKDLATWGAQLWHPTVGGAEVARERMRTVRGDDVHVIAGAGPVANQLSAAVGIAVWGIGAHRLAVGAGSPDEVGFGEDGFQSDLIVLPAEQVSAAVLCNHLQPDIHVASELAFRLLGTVRGHPVPHPDPYP